MHCCENRKIQLLSRKFLLWCQNSSFRQKNHFGNTEQKVRKYFLISFPFRRKFVQIFFVFSNEVNRKLLMPSCFFCKILKSSPCLDWLFFWWIDQPSLGRWDPVPRGEENHGRHQPAHHLQRVSTQVAQITMRRLAVRRPEPVFANHLRSPGIDFQPGGPVRQPYLSFWSARLHRLAESIPGLHKHLQIRALRLNHGLSECGWIAECVQETY